MHALINDAVFPMDLSMGNNTIEIIKPVYNPTVETAGYANANKLGCIAYGLSMGCILLK